MIVSVFSTGCWQIRQISRWAVSSGLCRKRGCESATEVNSRIRITDVRVLCVAAVWQKRISCIVQMTFTISFYFIFNYIKIICTSTSIDKMHRHNLWFAVFLQDRCIHVVFFFFISSLQTFKNFEFITRGVCVFNFKRNSIGDQKFNFQLKDCCFVRH